jgi:hypothetical protein
LPVLPCEAGWRDEADFDRQEQMVLRVDEGVVLLQGTCTCLLAWRENRACPAFAYVRLDFRTEPPFDCADDNSGDIAFVRATKFIGGRDAVEEFLACGTYLLSADVGFNRVIDGVTPFSMLKLSLPKFVSIRKDDGYDVQFFG